MTHSYLPLLLCYPFIHACLPKCIIAFFYYRSFFYTKLMPFVIMLSKAPNRLDLHIYYIWTPGISKIVEGSTKKSLVVLTTMPPQRGTPMAMLSTLLSSAEPWTTPCTMAISDSVELMANITRVRRTCTAPVKPMNCRRIPIVVNILVWWVLKWFFFKGKR